MRRFFRIAIWPLIAAAPMVAASADPARFFREPRCVAAFALLVLGLAIESTMVDPKSADAANQKEQVRRDRWSFELAALTNIACFYAPVADFLHLPEVVPRNTGTWIAGFALMVIGEGLRVHALHTLGRFFTMRVAVLPGHQVVRSGAYRWVRHPAYTGWFLLSVGFGLFFGSLVGLLGTALFVVVLGWRVKVEEAALRESLGDAYRRYAEEVRYRFVPGIF